MTMKRTAALGLAVLALSPLAQASRGSDGTLKLLYWQAPSTMNPYMSGGTKELEASSVVLEPLARFDPTGKMVPYLAAEIPTVANGGVAKDLKSITWTLKPNLKWSDGSAVTSEDVVFTANYCMDPKGGCASISQFGGIESVTAVDKLNVKITFKDVQPNPYSAFVNYKSPVLQAKQFAKCLGAAATTCTEQNFNPIGTGPFAVTEFKPNDVIQFKANANYRDANKPAFANLILKGGGKAADAARAVFQTGEFDYAWNLQIAPDVMESLIKGGKGKQVVAFGSLVERIEVNQTDPDTKWPESERSTPKHPHPFLTDLRVRRALSMAIDRKTLAEVGYGPAGRATCNLIPAPVALAADNTDCLTQDIAGAKKLLDEAGWKPGADGVRVKDGRRLKLVYATSTNAVRQDFQALIKQWWSEIGVDTELKAIPANVFFGGDAGNPDMLWKFNSDVQMFANNFSGTDPQAYLGNQTCGKEPSPDNKWHGPNISRYCDPTYDKLFAKLNTTADLGERAKIIKTLNLILTRDALTTLPLVWRGTNSGVSNTIKGEQINGWDSELWNIADWSRIK